MNKGQLTANTRTATATEIKNFLSMMLNIFTPFFNLCERWAYRNGTTIPKVLNFVATERDIKTEAPI